MRLTFIDLETTSTDSNLTNIIQLWVRRIIDGVIEKEIDSYFSNNWQYITLGSRNITGITEKNLIWKIPFENSEERDFLQQYSWDSIFVAHNGKSFDFKILGRYDVSFKYIIDTLSVAQIILDDKFEELEQSFKLGHLRYWMEDKWYIVLPENLEAHNAYDDIIILEQVFYWLIKIYQEKYPEKTEKDVLSDFVLMTTKPQLLTKFPFWKHKGVPFQDVPRSYLTWCMANMTELDDNLKYTIEHYLTVTTSTATLPVTPQVKNIPPVVSVPPLPEIQMITATENILAVDPSTFNFNK